MRSLNTSHCHRITRDVEYSTDATSSPYPGGSDMLLIDSEDPTFIASAIAHMLPDIPAKKRKK